MSTKDKIQLRALNIEDAKQTWKWRNQEGVRSDFSGHPFPVSYEDELDWYQKNIKVNFPNTVFGIETSTGNQLVGMAFLKNINLIHRHAEFAILVDANQSGKGYGKEACYKTIQFAFENLGLNRVYLKVRKENAAAIRIYESCGFKIEGTLREDVYKLGKFSDQLVMGVLAREFTGQ